MACAREPRRFPNRARPRRAGCVRRPPRGGVACDATRPQGSRQRRSRSGSGSTLGDGGAVCIGVVRQQDRAVRGRARHNTCGRQLIVGGRMSQKGSQREKRTKFQTRSQTRGRGVVLVGSFVAWWMTHDWSFMYAGRYPSSSPSWYFESSASSKRRNSTAVSGPTSGGRDDSH